MLSEPEDGRFHLTVAERPLVQRVLLPDSSPRSMAVGLPSGLNYCFDTRSCAVQYGWFGGFLDVGPERGYGNSRGGGTCEILGERFGVGTVDSPLRIGDPKAEPRLAFLGYRRDETAAPELMYRVDGVKVHQAVTGIPGEIGLRSRFRIGETEGRAIYFVVEPKGLKLSASAGEWKEGRLKIPAEQQSGILYVESA